ncbi:hypothetical protein AYI68_g5751, partial [Smittium mucronatum]
MGPKDLEKGFKIPFKKSETNIHSPQFPLNLSTFTPHLRRKISLEEQATLLRKVSLPSHFVRMSVPLTNHPHRYKRKMTKEANKVITEEVSALLTKNAIEEVKAGSKGFYSNLFTIPKKAGDLRPEFGNPNGCISGRPDNIRRVEGNMLKEHRSSFQQTYGTGIQNQALQVIPDSIPVNSTLRYNHQHEINVPQGNICQDQGSKKRRSETHQHQEYLNKELRIVHWKILVNVNSSLAWTSNATQNTRAKELFSQRNRRQAEDLERSMFPTRKSRPRGIHGRQRPCMGNSDCFRFLFWFMEFYRKVEAHQREGVDRCLQSLMPTPISRPFSSDIFRQYNYNGVRQEIWRNNIQRTIRDRGRDVKTLLGNKATTSNIIHSVIDQSGRCSKQTYSPDGMVSIRLSIQQALIDLRPSRCRSIRITFKQKDRPILQLVQGENHNRPEFSNAQLENLEESLLLPTVESNFSDSTENISREDNSNDSKPILEIGDMVPNNNANGNDAPDNDICHRSYTRSKKRKISALEEQGMEANCMESQWSTIETQGLKEYAADILFNNKRRIR